MKLNLLLMFTCINILIACSGQNVQAANQHSEKHSALQHPNTLDASNNGLNKTTSCTKEAYQTVSRCLYVKVNCLPTQLDCKDVDLTIIEKATGKSEKLKGEIWFNVVNGDFRGYRFKDKTGTYSMYLREISIFKLSDKSGKNMIFKEEIISSPKNEANSF